MTVLARAFALALAAALIVGVAAEPLPTGNRDVVDALSAGLERLVVSGEYNALVSQWVPQALPLVADVSYWTCGFDASPANGSFSRAFPAPLSGGTLARVLRTGALVVGSTLDFCPFMCRADGNETGMVIGFEKDLLEGIVAKMSAHYGVAIQLVIDEVEITGQFFADLVTALNAADSALDMVSSSVTILAARTDLAEFSCSYFVSPLGFLRSQLEPERNFTSLASLNAAGVVVSVEAGTTAELYALGHLPLAQLLVRTSQSDVLADLRTFTAHVAIEDYFIIESVPVAQRADCGDCALLGFQATTADSSVDMWYGFVARLEIPPNANSVAERTIVGLERGLGAAVVAFIALVLFALAVTVAVCFAKVCVPSVGELHGPKALYRPAPFAGGGRTFAHPNALIGRPRWATTDDIPHSSDRSDESDDFFRATHRA